jgi:hypothetical protein
MAANSVQASLTISAWSLLNARGARAEAQNHDHFNGS